MPRMVEGYCDMNLRRARSKYYEDKEDRVTWIIVFKEASIRHFIQRSIYIFAPSRSTRWEKLRERDFLFTNAATNLGKSYCIPQSLFVFFVWIAYILHNIVFFFFQVTIV